MLGWRHGACRQTGSAHCATSKGVDYRWCNNTIGRRCCAGARGLLTSLQSSHNNCRSGQVGRTTAVALRPCCLAWWPASHTSDTLQNIIKVGGFGFRPSAAFFTDLASSHQTACVMDTPALTDRSASMSRPEDVLLATRRLLWGRRTMPLDSRLTDCVTSLPSGR
jgi:hypothetical protein